MPIKRVFLVLCIGMLVAGIAPFLNNYFDTPETAVQNYKSKYLSDFEVSSENRVESGGGYVYGLKQHSRDEYRLCYVWRENSKWNVLNIGSIIPQELSGGTPSGIDGKQVNWSYSAVWAKENSETKAVVAYIRLEGGGSKPIPFSLEQIGKLPIWIHKFSRTVFMTVNAEGYDSMGNLVWKY